MREAHEHSWRMRMAGLVAEASRIDAIAHSWRRIVGRVCVGCICERYPRAFAKEEVGERRRHM